MQQRLPTLVEVQTGFAHRGARDRAPDNTMEAFETALGLGASGLESDLWVTSDGVAVLDHDGVVRARFRNNPISSVPRVDLPAHIPGAKDLLRLAKGSAHVSLDVKDAASLGGLRDAVEVTGFDPAALWLCSPDMDVLESARAIIQGVRLVHSTRVARLGVSMETHCARLSSFGADALNLHHSEWTGGQVVMCHRFSVRAFAWDIQQEDTMNNILRMGVDAVYSDNSEMMMAAISREAVARSSAS